MIMREMRSSFTETMASISHEPSLEYETQAHYGSDVEGCSKLKARRCLLHAPEACSSYPTPMEGFHVDARLREVRRPRGQKAEARVPVRLRQMPCGHKPTD
jgi:hypothetical protein